LRTNCFGIRRNEDLTMSEELIFPDEPFKVSGPLTFEIIEEVYKREKERNIEPQAGYWNQQCEDFILKKKKDQ
jgi:hypothetical protein